MKKKEMKRKEEKWEKDYTRLKEEGKRMNKEIKERRK